MNLGPSQKIVDEIRGVLVLGRGPLGPLGPRETSPTLQNRSWSSVYSTVHDESENTSFSNEEVA